MKIDMSFDELNDHLNELRAALNNPKTFIFSFDVGDGPDVLTKHAQVDMGNQHISVKLSTRTGKANKTLGKMHMVDLRLLQDESCYVEV